MFEVSIALLQQYIELRQRHDPHFPVGVLSEARFRLDQLDYVLMRVHELETGSLELNIRFDSATLLRTYAECFYYSAARLCALCRKNKALGLSQFHPTAVIRVRNQLIEHPEGPDGAPILAWSLRYEDGRGPVLHGEG